MILDVEFEEMNSEFEADFGEVYRITDADIIEVNEALDECVHGYVTGAGYAENVGEAVAAIEDVGAAIAQKGVTLPDVPGGYGDVIRSELSAGADINSEWTNWSYAYAYNRTDFLDKLKYSDTANGQLFSFMFVNSTNIDTVPLFDLSNATDCENMFYNCSISSLPPLDFSNVINAKNIFQACIKMVNYPALDFRNATLVSQMFLNNNVVTSIECLNISSATSTAHMFTSVRTLKEIRFDGVIPIGISFQWAKNLSMESVKSALIHLKDYSGTDEEFTHKMTFESTVWTKFNATECTEGYPSWADYVYSKGWNV